MATTTTLQCFLVLLLALLVVAQQPVQVDWSSKTYGPDGPWHALQIDVGDLAGTPTQSIDLLPGGFLNSQLIASTACDNIKGTCYAQRAGLYDWANSNSVVNVTLPKQLSDTTPVFYEAPLLANGTTSVQLDTMYLNNQLNPLTRMTIFSLDEVVNILPNGTGYQATIGTFGLGGPPMDHATLKIKIGAKDNPATQMFADHTIASASFGLHIGSVEPPISGSLWYGGYDKSRVVGPVNSQQYLLNGQATTVGGVVVLAIDLIDITLDVAADRGGSPFSPANQSGLLKPDDDSTSIPLRPGGETPYLHLPKATCDALAAQLPVTYHPDFNVYFWNTDDPQYKRIVTSPSYMGFVFRSNNLNNLTINVPFMLLNLTLSPPLMAEPTPYFPCYPSPDPFYVLGRSFLQAAFFGANWNAAAPPGNWWLAQAPGPNTDSNPSPTTIESSQENISGFENADWAKTWDGYWTPLPASSSSDSNASSQGSSGLSTGAEAGIGVGVAVVALLAICAVLFLLYRRRQKKKKQAQRADSDTERVIDTIKGEPKADPGVSSDSDTSTPGDHTATASSAADATRTNSTPNMTEVSSSLAAVERFELDSDGPARHEIAAPLGEGDARRELDGAERLEMDGGIKPEMDGAGPVVGSALNPAETGAGRENERFEMPTSIQMTPLTTPVEDRKYVTVQAVKDAIIKRQDEEIALADVVHETRGDDAEEVQRTATPISEAEKRRLWAKYNGTS